MKKIFLLAFIFVSICGKGQSLLVPGIGIVDTKWLKNRTYEMNWSIIRDTVRMDIGSIRTEIKNQDGKLAVITKVVLKQSAAPWTDSTMADAGTLKPIYHSSYNSKRDMVLRYGQVVNGYYFDKAKQEKTSVADTITSACFDSNLYPNIIAWLPLKVGYTKEIAIYDYNSPAKSGVFKAIIQDVKIGEYKSSKSGPHKVWVATVTDNLNPDSGAVSTYYIDMADRQSWKQEVVMKGSKIEMVLKEN